MSSKVERRGEQGKGLRIQVSSLCFLNLVDRLALLVQRQGFKKVITVESRVHVGFLVREDRASGESWKSEMIRIRRQRGKDLSGIVQGKSSRTK